MDRDIPEVTVRSFEHSMHPTLISFPIACFSGALVTDIAYAVTADMMWADFSDWLLAAGLFVGVLAAIASIIDVFGHREMRGQAASWLYLLGSLVVLALAVLDNLVHSRDAWTSVVPTGLILSAALVIVMGAVIWLGSGRVYRQPVAVRRVGRA
jgi:uncharacterized membrane protein